MRTSRVFGGTAARTAAVLAVAGGLLTGCGIRSTSVPVDAGPAPSREACAVPRTNPTPGPDTVLRQVYLVCGMQIAPVRRLVPADASARSLLAQLQRSLLPEETTAGFVSAVPGTLEFVPAWKGDPPGTLRLNQDLDELPSFALAQIVCTLTDPPSPATTPAPTLTLGGATPGSKPRTYSCTSDLRTRPEAADSAGTPAK
ncbi:hypothetical protein [Actinacidiphila acididurans]|uniref:Lipoprotein n=1 Tax=Actinacidiphila acididurans TaxID=2784346 RepID=A0ABS2TMP7_9ACTN|nr:hypothetical protein [Actinacidiphila acididurans]MBM9504625.1 hypothetical protein [Actinacidiphila acididurans]